MPSCPGASSAWATARGERSVKWGTPFPLVAGSTLPSQNSTSNGRSGRARWSSSRNGPVRARATYLWYVREQLQAVAERVIHVEAAVARELVVPADLPEPRRQLLQRLD